MRASALDSVPIQLTFSSPAGCPTRADVLHAIAAQLPDDFRTSTTLRARAQLIDHGPQDFELVLEYSSNSGVPDRRRVRSESCEAAADAAALLLSLALVPSTAQDSSPPPTAAAQAAPALAHNEVGALGLLDSALLPRSAYGGGLQLGFSLGAWRIQLSAAQWGMANTERGIVHVQLDYWSADVGVCYLWQWSALQTGPCAQLEIGRMGGFADPAIGAQPRGARLQTVRLSAQTRLRIYSPLWLMLDLGFEWIERRPRFEVADLGLVHQPDVLGLRLGFGPLLLW
jgi:hypothetical protein